MSTADTVISLVPGIARSICENCGSHGYAVGPQARQVLAQAAAVHDRECQDLRDAARLLKAAEGIPGGVTTSLKISVEYIEDLLRPEQRRARAKAIWAGVLDRIGPP